MHQAASSFFQGGVFGCSSRMTGNLQVRFLEGWAPAMAPGHSTILGRASPGGLYEVYERKTTVFRSQKLCVLSCYFVAFCGAFLTRGFPFTMEFCTDRPVADPRVCGDLSQAVPYPFNSSVITLPSSPAS